MSTSIMEPQLTDAINADPALTAKGLRAVPGRPSGVLVERGGFVVGVWHWRHGAFELTPAGADAPTVELETIAEAVRHTRERLAAAD